MRRQLGIKPKDRVTIRLEGDGLKVRPARSRLDDIYQSVPALDRPLTDREVSDIAWDEHAEEIARQGRL